MPSASVFKIDEAGVQETVYSDHGPVGNHINGIGRQVVFLARRYVGKNTHKLERRISARTHRTPEGLVLEVIADTKYALEHHNGTRPHMIMPHKSRMLRFQQGGKVVYAHRVMHPGTRPNPFLMTALREAVK